MQLRGEAFLNISGRALRKDFILKLGITNASGKAVLGGTKYHSVDFLFSLFRAFRSPDQVSCFSVETKEIICIEREFNSHRTNMNTFLPDFPLFGCRDVMCKHSIREGSRKGVPDEDIFQDFYQFKLNSSANSCIAVFSLTALLSKKLEIT